MYTFSGRALDLSFMSAFWITLSSTPDSSILRHKLLPHYPFRINALSLFCLSRSPKTRTLNRGLMGYVVIFGERPQWERHVLERPKLPSWRMGNGMAKESALCHWMPEISIQSYGDDAMGCQCANPKVMNSEFFVKLPELHVHIGDGGLIFYDRYFFLSSLFFRPLISEVAERNSTKIGHMLGTRPKCDLKTHVQNLGYPLCYKSGAQKLPFWTISQLNGNFNGLYPHGIHNRESALTTTWGLLHRPKMSWTLVHKRLQTGSPLLPTICKFCFLRHCQASQTEINKPNSTKLRQTADGKWR